MGTPARAQEMLGGLPQGEDDRGVVLRLPRSRPRWADPEGACRSRPVETVGGRPGGNSRRQARESPAIDSPQIQRLLEIGGIVARGMKEEGPGTSEKGGKPRQIDRSSC